MRKGKAFKLFTCCIPVMGFNRFIICDLQRDDIYFIDEGLYEILTENIGETLDAIKFKYQNKYDDIIEVYIDFLIENELGFFTDEPESFPNINRLWESPDILTNSVIEYSSNSTYDFNDLVVQLELEGCKFIELRLHQLGSFLKLEEVLNTFDNSKVRNLDIFIEYENYFKDIDWSNLLLKFQRIGSIMIYSAPLDFELKRDLNGRITLTIEPLSNMHCGVVDISYFTSNLSLFMEAQLHNTCLNRKIAIDVDGNIKNCPSMPHSYGNIKDTTLREALEHPDFKKYWYIHKDQIEVCRDCEFRYICTDCRAYLEDPDNLYSKPLKCGYNPYTCEWEEWSTNPLKQKAIEYYGMQELVKKEPE
jgi:SPASM domain peptide maturase of grasp-with-spasm system